MSNKEEVLNDLLGYEGLKIYQRPDLFNFSLDSTILAYYSTVNAKTKKIMDLCCGNAYIPIFLTLRTNAHIDGIEIQKLSYDLAQKSVSYNNLNDQITIYNEDLKNAHLFLGVSQYDLVTVNPPYFEYKDTSLVNDSDYLTIARHEVKVTLNEVVREAFILLKDGGTFSMVHRASRLVDCLNAFRENNIEPKRLLFIYPKTNSEEALAIFIEGKRSRKKGSLKILPPLYVTDENGNYTKEILKIFNYQKGDEHVN